jgi:membrane protease YdiL (CAAX protease family)
MIQATGRSAAEAPEAGAGRAWALLEVIAFSALVLGLGPLVAEIGAPPFLTFVANPLILGCVWFTPLWARRQRGGDRGPAPERAAPQVWSAGRTALVCLAATLLFFTFKLFVSPAFDGLAETYLGGDRLAQTREYAFLRGDPEAFAQWLALIWLFAALGEEVFFRGLLLSRLETAFGDGFAACFLAVALQAAAFAFHHFESGPVAVVQSLASGLYLGVCYVLAGRRLVPVIVAHGLWDSFGLTMLFLGIADSDGA